MKSTNCLLCKILILFSRSLLSQYVMDSLYDTVVFPILQSIPVKQVITTSELDLLNQSDAPGLLTASKRKKVLNTVDFLDICKRFNEKS